MLRRFMTLLAMLLVTACGSSTKSPANGATPGPQFGTAGEACSDEGVAACGLAGTSPATVVCASGVWQPTTVCPPGSVCTLNEGTPLCSAQTKADAGSSAGNTDAGNGTGNADAGSSAGNTDAGNGTGNADAGSSAGNTDAGNGTGNADAGSSAGNNDAGNGAGNCTTAQDCDDKNPCTSDGCTAGVCTYSATVNAPCDDDNLCTSKDACGADGKCAGVAVNCDDANPCTVDACQKGQCSHLPPEDAIACDDGNGCTVADACVAGTCSGKPKKCDDGNPCTIDACTSGDCAYKPQEAAACDDGDACTLLDACTAAGQCVGVAKNCSDGKDCTSDVCSKGECTNLPLAGTPCDDGNACSVDDKCTATATCVGTAKVCDDGSKCSFDSCVMGVCKFVDTGVCKAGTDPVTAIELKNGQWKNYDFALGHMWFSVQASAGDVFLVASAPTYAEVGDPSAPDVVVEILSEGQVIATNHKDDFWENFDALLYTVAPATGSYLVRVSTCADWKALHPTTSVECLNNGKTTDTAYSLLFMNDALSKAGSNLSTKEAEPNDSVDKATPWTFNSSEPGYYYYHVLTGLLAIADAADIFATTIPADVSITTGRPTLWLVGHENAPPFTSGTSLTSFKLSVVDALSNKVVAQLTQPRPIMAVPVKAGGKYYVRLDTPTLKGTAQPFYLVDSHVRQSTQIEAKEGSNDSMFTPEPLGGYGKSYGYDWYSVAGDLTSNGKDVDFYTLPVQLSGAAISVACSSAEWGSGVQGFSVTAYQPDGTPIANGSATEKGDGLLLKLPDVSDGNVIFKVSATGQSATVTGGFYQCTFYRVPKPGSGSKGHYCDNACGKSGAGGCYCDAECVKAGDCCNADGSAPDKSAPSTSCAGSTCGECNAGCGNDTCDGGETEATCKADCCGVTTCANEIQDCQLDASCVSIVQCIQGCADDACANDCFAKGTNSGKQATQELLACFGFNCPQ